MPSDDKRFDFHKHAPENNGARTLAGVPAAASASGGGSVLTNV